MDDNLKDLVAPIRASSMAVEGALLFSWRSACELIRQDVPGALIECGTWMGGLSFGLALAQKRLFGRVVRPVHMLDSFQGLPPATAREGPAAHESQARTDEPGYLDNCRAPLERVVAVRDSLGSPRRIVSLPRAGSTTPSLPCGLASRPSASPGFASIATGTSQSAMCWTSLSRSSQMAGP